MVHHASAETPNVNMFLQTTPVRDSGDLHTVQPVSHSKHLRAASLPDAHLDVGCTQALKSNDGR